MSGRTRWGSGTVVLACALTILLGLAAVACGRGNDAGDAATGPAGGGPIPGAGEEFDGCQLIQRWDAHEILQGSVRPVPKPAEHPAAATCAWEVQEEDATRSLQLSIFRGDELYARDAFEGDPSFEEAEGLGDGAFFVEPSGVQLHFLTGEYSVVLSVEGFEGEEPLARETVRDQLLRLGGRIASWLCDPSAAACSWDQRPVERGG